MWWVVNGVMHMLNKIILLIYGYLFTNRKLQNATTLKVDGREFSLSLMGDGRDLALWAPASFCCFSVLLVGGFQDFRMKVTPLEWSSDLMTSGEYIRRSHVLFWWDGRLGSSVRCLRCRQGVVDSLSTINLKFKESYFKLHTTWVPRAERNC